MVYITGSQPGSGSEKNASYRSLSEMPGVAWGKITNVGGRLEIPEYGVMLTIPEGALPPETQRLMYIAVTFNLGPQLGERQVRFFSFFF